MGSCKVAEEMRTALVFILAFTTALAGKKYLIETGNVEPEKIEDDYSGTKGGHYPNSCTLEDQRVLYDGDRGVCPDACNLCMCIKGKLYGGHEPCGTGSVPRTWIQAQFAYLGIFLIPAPQPDFVQRRK